MVREILELNEDAGKYLVRRRDEFLDQFIVGRAGDAVLAQAYIKRVFEQRFIVGADVDGDRQAQIGMHAGAGGIQRQLAHRYAHAVGAEISKPQYPLAVGDDDQLRGMGPVAQDLLDAAAIVGADEKAARALENVAELLAREAYGRRVDQRLHLVDVVAQHAEKQRLVAVVQRIQRDELVERIGEAAQIDQHARRLLVLAQHMRRQETAQAKRIALPLGKCGATVERGILQ